MKTLIKLIPIILVLTGIIGLSSCEKKRDESGKGKLEISLNLPDGTSHSKSGAFTDSSGVVSYHLMISIEDMEGNIVMSDSLIPLYTFGTGYVSQNVELKTGEYKLSKFMVINPSGEVIFAAPVKGAPLAYLVNRPLPFTFAIFTNQVTRIVPEVLAVGDQTPDQFGYANFGMQIILPLHFWALCIIDNPLSMAPGLQITTAKLTVYDANKWHYTFNLEAATNHLIIKGGSPVYYFLLEKEGYMPQKMEFTARQLMATTQADPLVLKIPWDSTTVNLAKDLVAYYPFNGSASDKSGNNHHGIVHGATLTEDRGGNKNCAYYFDGIDDYIEVPDDPSLRITDEITIELWTSMEYGGGGDDPRLVSKGGDYDGFELCTDGPQGYGTISVRIAPPSLFIKDVLTANKWDHIVAVVDQKFIKLYLNGRLKGSIERNGPILESSQPLCFGQKSIWGWDKYKGKIDDVRIWKRALSENEILALFKY